MVGKRGRRRITGTTKAVADAERRSWIRRTVPDSRARCWGYCTDVWEPQILPDCAL